MSRRPLSILNISEQEFSDLQGNLDPGTMYRVVDTSGRPLRTVTPDGQVVGGGSTFAPGAAMINIGATPSVSTTHDGRTMHMAIPVPFEYTGVQILIPHLGGSGAMNGVKLCVAASDDIGPGDYSLGTGDVTLKKFLVPHRGGTVTNSSTADQGETGWQRVVRGAENAFDLQDRGAFRWDTVLTDRVNLRGLRDVTYTSRFPLLVRFQTPGNVLTRTSYAGTHTADQFKVDGGGVPPFLFATRNGDRVTDPGSWGIADTPTFSTSPLIPLGIVLFGAARYSAVLFSMDSRGAISTETSAAAAYRSTEFYFETQAKNTKYTVVKSSWAARTEDEYSAFAIALMQGGRNTIQHVIHLIDSVNDGPVTQETINANKATALAVKASADAIRAETTFLVTYPRSTVIPGDQMALLNELDTWARQNARRVFNPLQVYGKADGTWRTGVGFDGNHMVNTAYADMASRLYDLLDFG